MRKGLEKVYIEEKDANQIHREQEDEANKREKKGKKKEEERKEEGTEEREDEEEEGKEGKDEEEELDWDERKKSWISWIRCYHHFPDYI